MANGDVSFPKIADTNWWKLRDLFKRKVPAIVTPTYLATALSMGEASARSNLISPFKKIGIIDEDGKPTDLAYDWRDDHKYADVCSSLIDKCYPQEIKDLFHSPDADPQKLTSWFMSDARCGQPAAKHFARFYLLLLRADLSEAEAASAKSEAKLKSPKPETKKNDTKTQTQKIVEPAPTRPVAETAPIVQSQPTQTVLRNAPELHINVQLHISPESSADQIDKIFESMAKHLKDFNK
jgi:hypothetical protein